LIALFNIFLKHLSKEEVETLKAELFNGC